MILWVMLVGMYDLPHRRVSAAFAVVAEWRRGAPARISGVHSRALRQDAILQRVAGDLQSSPTTKGEPDGPHPLIPSLVQQERLLA